MFALLTRLLIMSAWSLLVKADQQLLQADLGISFSHTEVAQIIEELGICAGGQHTPRLQRLQQALNGCQVLWHCPSDALQLFKI